MKQLAGTLFVHDAIRFDYHVKESVQCLLGLCDHVYVVDAGSTDGTVEELIEMAKENKKLTVLFMTKEAWSAQVGREKLNYFSNIAIKRAEEDGYEYQINLQADEIIHENSYDAIRKACDTGEEGFLCKRINLWKDPYHYLEVEHHRKPCSTEIVRLTKTCYRSYGDAESVAAPFRRNFTEDIVFYHMGFVRNRVKMIEKSIHMQRDVFLVEPDKKLEGLTKFKPELWFEDKDLRPITEPLPSLIQQWAYERSNF